MVPKGQPKTAWTRPGRPAGVRRAARGWRLGSGLIVAGFVVPRYRTTSESTTGEVAYGSDTLVGVNGPGVVVVLAVPFVVTDLVGCALLLQAHRGALMSQLPELAEAGGFRHVRPFIPGGPRMEW